MSFLFAAETASQGVPLFPLVVTGLFFFAILAIAAWGMTKTKNVDDFFLGGHLLGPWILAISYGAAYFSAVIFIGFAGTYGWQCSFKSLWIGIGNAVVGGLLAWLVLGKQTRKMTRRLGASTMPEFFKERYGSHRMKCFGAVAIFIFLLPYSAGVFGGLTYLFQAVFHIDMKVALTVITAITGVYLVLGGYKAAARIDFLQGMIMFVGAIAMVMLVWRYFAVQQADTRRRRRRDRRVQSAARCETPVAEGGLGGKPVSNLLFWSVVFMSSIATWVCRKWSKSTTPSKTKIKLSKARSSAVFALLSACRVFDRLVFAPHVAGTTARNAQSAAKSASTGSSRRCSSTRLRTARGSSRSSCSLFFPRRCLRCARSR